MTVAATTNRKTYTGDNVTTSFATSPVIFYLSSNLQVRVTVIATGVSTLLTENTHYTVTGGSAAGAVGTVNLAGGSSPHGALLSTEKLVILRVLPLTQGVDLVNNNNSDAEVIETALDKLTDVDQQLSERQDRAITFSEGDVSGSTNTLQDASTRAGRILGFDALGLLTTIVVTVGTSLVDLAASTGAALIGFLQAGTGAVLRTLRDKLFDIVSVKDYGAVLDGVADDTAALNAAFARVGKTVLVPVGNARITSNLNEPLCSAIVGEGPLSKITAAAGVTNVFKIGTAAVNLAEMKNIAIYGNATANAIGVILGNNELINLQRLVNVRIFNFTGTSAIGLDIRDAVTIELVNVYVSNHTLCVRIGTGVVAGTPTTIYWKEGGIRTSAGVGCQINSGYNIVFDGTVFENNVHEGCYVGTNVAGTVQPVVFRDCWFEGNWASDITKFQLVFDGTTTEVHPQVEGGYFNISGATAKAIRFTGAFVRSGYLNMVEMASRSGAIKIDTGAIVTVGSFPNNLVYSTVVDDTTTTTRYVEKALDAWTAYVPVYSTNVGNAATSFTGTPTTNLARYRVVGKTFQISISFNATLNAITPSTISATFPSSFTPHDALSFSTAVVANAGTLEVGKVRAVASPDLLSFTRINGANWGSGATFECDVVYSCELA